MLSDEGGNERWVFFFIFTLIFLGFKVLGKTTTQEKYSIHHKERNVKWTPDVKAQNSRLKYEIINAICIKMHNK